MLLDVGGELIWLSGMGHRVVAANIFYPKSPRYDGKPKKEKQTAWQNSKSGVFNF
jgi:hypothetical protein